VYSDETVTTQHSNVRLSTALSDLGCNAGIHITLASDVEDVTIRELMFVKVSFHDGFVHVVYGHRCSHPLRDLFRNESLTRMIVLDTFAARPAHGLACHAKCA
jgi:hypothetical protein